MQVPLWSFSKPTESTVRNFLNRQRTEEFAYRAVGATVGHPPRGYAYNDNQVHLGEGDAIFKQAVDALFSWEMFPKAWTGITALESDEIRLGLTLAVQAHACGLWWLNACRVVSPTGHCLLMWSRGRNCFPSNNGRMAPCGIGCRHFHVPDTGR